MGSAELQPTSVAIHPRPTDVLLFMTQVALFPIPNLVAFPGSTVPLHVFEPRYRRMVRESVESNRMIAVTHTRKVIQQARDMSSIEEALASNQATYQPHDVFSAGHCQVIEELPDGRIHAQIEVSVRLQQVQEIQTLPYKIVEAVELVDEDLTDTAALEAVASRINAGLQSVAEAQSPELQSMLAESRWRNLTARELSFKIFELLRAEPDFMQNVLETPSAGERLRIADQIISQISG